LIFQPNILKISTDIHFMLKNKNFAKCKQSLLIHSSACLVRCFA